MSGNIWKGALSFGLLNIPVSLMKAEQDHSLSFSMLDSSDLSPIKYKKINAKTGKEVPWNKIVKGYEYEKGEFVVMTKKDFATANPEASGTIDIESFIDLAEVDPMYLEKPYYVVPDKNGIKGYFLLVEAMKKSGKVAIGKIVIRTKQHLGLIMVHEDYLILELLRFSHEILSSHDVDYFAGLKRAKFSAKELKMAQDLIEGMSEPWKPEQFKHTYNEDIKNIIHKKIKAGGVHSLEVENPRKIKSTNTNVVDLMPLLKQSLEANKVSKKKPTHKKKVA